MTITYLAGPINGCTDDEANNWRDVAKARLGEENTLDPMRRDYRGQENDPGIDKQIVHGDFVDILDSDVMLANCWQVSWGTAMEIFFAADQGKKVIAVLPEGGRISPWLSYHATVVHSLDAALALIEGELP